MQQDSVVALHQHRNSLEQKSSFPVIAWRQDLSFQIGKELASRRVAEGFDCDGRKEVIASNAGIFFQVNTIFLSAEE